MAMYLMENNRCVGEINEVTFELTPRMDLNEFGVLTPMLKSARMMETFLNDRLAKPYNPLIDEILAMYGMKEFDLIEFAKRSRAMKFTDYFWIATDENKHEQIEDFHPLFN